ncbi:MAG: glycine cleavage system protein H [candidate division KSB1 bacterium]|jgi:glycine cleavage system H protein|nr:glycine cleavage system protein H [candidate division KSB1 bacterium]
MRNLKEPSIPKLIKRNPDICEWVELGVLSYKICDRHFDCQNCPLDKILRGFYGNEIGEERNLFHYFSSLSNLAKIRQDENFYVNPQHIWIEVTNQNEVKIGIDNLLAVVLGSIDRLQLPREKTRIKSDGCCAEIVKSPHVFPLPSPLDGEIVAVNSALGESPARLTDDPLDSGWLLTVKPDQLSSDLLYCRNRDSLFSWYLKKMDWLDYKLHSHGFNKTRASSDDQAGDDGRTTEIQKSIGEDDYQEIVMTLLGHVDCT